MTLAVAACKGLMYESAQKAFKEFEERQTADAAEATSIASAYDLKSAPPTDGAAGTMCSKSKEADAVTGLYRAKCSENLCCGSANKYLRDGTRLTVESCQAATAQTYTFYPKLKPGALEAPQAETWRFYCIMGAQRLAATLVAGTAAAYLMA